MIYKPICQPELQDQTNSYLYVDTIFSLSVSVVQLADLTDTFVWTVKVNKGDAAFTLTCEVKASKKTGPQHLLRIILG